MANVKYDTVIIGGGIAGLMSSVRLAAAGQRVVLFEQGLMGGQSTTSNHGIIHSGAFYAKWHPEMVRDCQEAIDLYMQTFPHAVLSTRSVGYGTPEAIADMKQQWIPLGCPFEDITADSVRHIFNDQALERFHFVSGNDASVSTREIVRSLVRVAESLGAELHPRTPVAHVVASGGRVTGVELSSGHVVSARNVIVCAALGTYGLTARLGLHLDKRMRSRLDMMVAFSGRGLDSVVLSHDFGGANIAPAADGYVLASPYGGEQPRVMRYRRYAVPISKMASLIRDLKTNIREGLIDYESANAHMCSKTEYVDRNIDQFGGQPGFAVIDHGTEDHINNLWTLLPGKMTLGFHVTHALVERMFRRRMPLELPVPIRPGDDEKSDSLVDLYPWQAVAAETIPA